MSLDGGAEVTSDAFPTEIGNGLYSFLLSQSETNAETIVIYGTCITANTSVQPQIIFTTPLYIAGITGNITRQYDWKHYSEI